MCHDCSLQELCAVSENGLRATAAALWQGRGWTQQCVCCCIFGTNVSSRLAGCLFIMAKGPVKKLIVPQMLEVRNPASYETISYITILTTVRY